LQKITKKKGGPRAAHGSYAKTTGKGWKKARKRFVAGRPGGQENEEREAGNPPQETKRLQERKKKNLVVG